MQSHVHVHVRVFFILPLVSLNTLKILLVFASFLRSMFFICLKVTEYHEYNEIVSPKIDLYSFKRNY